MFTTFIMYTHPIHQLGYLIGKIVLIALSIGILIGILPEGAVSVTKAQSNNGDWSPPVAIVSTEGTLAESNMAWVADQAGQLHLFFSHQPDRSLPYSIDYIRWDRSGWSEPIDVLVEGGNPVPIRAAIDSRQIIHLIWQGANGLTYASAPAIQAGQAQAWSKPQVIADVVFEADIVAGPDSTLHVAYPNVSGEVSLIRSTNQGKNWSTPVTIAWGNVETLVGEVRLAMDGAERFHVVWTEYQLPRAWPPTGAFYTRSVDGGVTWESAQQMAEERHGQIGLVTVGQNEIHLVWRSNVGGDGTFHQWSNDGGETWQRPDQFADGGGFSGLPSFAIDSSDNLHYAIGPVFITSWSNGRLEPYLDVAGQTIRTAAEQKATVSVERGMIAITSGNRLHVVFETGFNELWYTSRLLDISEAPILPLPTVILPTPTPLPTLTPISANLTANVAPKVTVVVPPGGILAQTEPPNPGQPILVAILPVALIIGSIMIGRTIRLSRL